ncbi:MAG: tail fiber protein [Patescibacteria group bacterium]|nr:tail fiber protein [Patescibacteria group bacterium]
MAQAKIPNLSNAGSTLESHTAMLNQVKAILDAHALTGASVSLATFLAQLAGLSTPNVIGVPIGGIVDWPCDVLPPGPWIWADGAVYQIADKPALFSVYQYRHGGAGGFFYVPDRRGKFTRGIDTYGQGAGGNDLDVLTRTAVQTGGNAGNKVGSVQGGATARPTTPFTTGTEQMESGTSFVWSNPTTPVNHLTRGADDGIQGSASHHHTVTGGGDAETRPINDSTCYIIRYA